MAQSNTERHILNAAARIEGTVSTIKESLQTFSQKYSGLQTNYNDLLTKYNTLLESHPNPPAELTAETPAPAEDLSEEFETLDAALTGMESAGSSLRGAATAFSNSGMTDAQVGLGNPSVGTQIPAGQQGTEPLPTPPSGSQETGPTGQSIPPSEATTETTVDATDTQADESGGSEGNLDGGGVTPLATGEPGSGPASQTSEGIDTDDQTEADDI